jgi:hypothetical protein
MGKQDGSSPAEIAATTGCSRQVIYPLWKIGKNKEKSIAVKKCGRPFGYGRTPWCRKKRYKTFSLITILTS